MPSLDNELRRLQTLKALTKPVRAIIEIIVIIEQE